MHCSLLNSTKVVNAKKRTKFNFRLLLCFVEHLMATDITEVTDFKFPRIFRLNYIKSIQSSKQVSTTGASSTLIAEDISGVKSILTMSVAIKLLLCMDYVLDYD